MLLCTSQVAAKLEVAVEVARRNHDKLKSLDVLRFCPKTTCFILRFPFSLSCGSDPGFKRTQCVVRARGACLASFIKEQKRSEAHARLICIAPRQLRDDCSLRRNARHPRRAPETAFENTGWFQALRCKIRLKISCHSMRMLKAFFVLQIDVKNSSKKALCKHFRL